MIHTVLVGLGFGDEGKGATVDYLCATNDVKAVVRFSGGPQTAHNVVLPNGDHHTFAQFGSGTFHGTQTFLSRFMLVNPLNMVREADHLESLTGVDPFELLSIDRECLVVTPYHQAANRVRETARGASRHGSCGQGIGETQKYALDYPEDAIRIRDIVDMGFAPEGRLMLKMKLQLLRNRLVAEVGLLGNVYTEDEIIKLYAEFDYDRLSKANVCSSFALKSLLDSGMCVFEGSQGVLLDEWYGFHPHTTWSTTTFENAETLLTESGVAREDWDRLGVTRTYQTRHGMGPMPSENRYMSQSHPETHNVSYEWAGDWRVGPLDLALLKYAVSAIGGVDYIAVNHLDAADEWYAVIGYSDRRLLRPKHPDNKTDLLYQEVLTQLLENATTYQVGPIYDDEILKMIELVADAPVAFVGRGPTHKDRSVV